MKMALSVETMGFILRAVAYKDWTITVYQGAWHGPHLQIVARVPNAYRPGETVELDIHSSIPPVETLDEFLRWLMWRIIQVEVHEAREFFTYQGDRVFDPHADGSDQDLFEVDQKTPSGPTYEELRNEKNAAWTKTKEELATDPDVLAFREFIRATGTVGEDGDHVDRTPLEDEGCEHESWEDYGGNIVKCNECKVWFPRPKETES